jgi:hypothetical protein
MLTQWQARRLNKLAGDICTDRNLNRCFETGKAGYEIFEHGVLFYVAEFRLDSSHADYIRLAAKVIFENDKWTLLTAQLDRHNEFERWLEYPVDSLLKLHDLMNEVAMDKHKLIW